MKFAVLALLGLATVSASEQVFMDDELTDLLKISITGKNIQNIDHAARRLDQASRKV